jgi:hypothetical protein
MKDAHWMDISSPISSTFASAGVYTISAFTQHSIVSALDIIIIILNRIYITFGSTDSVV